MNSRFAVAPFVLSLVTTVTPAQDLEAVPVKDVNCLPAGKGAEPAWLTPFGSLLLFTAYTEIGHELWATDGTTAGTYLVRDIAPRNSSTPANLVASGDAVFFAAYEGIERELWRTDGTEAGTVRVSSINPGNALTAAGGLLYFVANDGVHGLELWTSDGTEAGTRMVVDLAPGPDSARVTELAELDGVLYFSRRLGGSGSHFDLWRSDGTAAGTLPVMEFGANSNSNISGLTGSGGDLFFVAVTDNDRELWRHDPATGQTVEIDVNPLAGSFPNELTDVDGTLYFRANVGGDDELYRLTGDTAVRVRDIHPEGSSFPQMLTAVSSGAGTRLFFSADDGVHGRELWVTDGTEAGTLMVADIDPSGDGIAMQNFFGAPPDIADVGGTLFFVADDGSGREPWSSDGTEAGTVELDIHPTGTSLPYWIVDFNGTAAFIARSGEGMFTIHDFVLGFDVWTSDGSLAGTARIEIAPDRTLPSFSLPQRVVGATLYFLANDREVLLPENDGDDLPVDYELWRTDGSRNGTRRVADINPAGSAFFRPDVFSFGELDGVLFFSATDSIVDGFTRRELWRSDGTEAGTALLMDIDSQDLLQSGSFPLDFTTVGGLVFFSADDGLTGRELWRTDGTLAGTQPVADINPGLAESLPRNLVEFAGVLYFAATDGIIGHELWRSDGTAAGTFLVRELQAGPGGPFFGESTVVSNTLFFTASSSLWMTDGTTAGTQQVAGVSSVTHLGALGDVLYLNAVGDAAGNELWRYDPQAQELERVTDIHPAGNSFPRELTEYDGALFFSADDGDQGRGLWRFDPDVGTPELIVRPVVQGDPEIDELIEVAGTLYFTARAGGPIPNRPRSDLWMSDGTPAGTRRMDFGRPLSMSPTYLVDVGGELMFRGFDFGVSAEIFKLRGTPHLSITSPLAGASINGLEVLVQGLVSDDRGVASVSVNHLAAALAPTGNPDDPAEMSFEVLVPLVAGENTLTAAAVDDDGYQVKVETVVIAGGGKRPRPAFRP